MERNEIYVIHGSDYAAMTRRLLERMDLQGDIGNRDQLIAIKPNLVLDSHPSDGATTHPEIVEGVITYLHDHGFHRIQVMEGSWVGARTGPALEVTGTRKVLERLGVPFVDLQKDSSRDYDAAGVKIKICDAIMAADYWINIPVMKGHCQTTITCALKNSKGLIPNSEKRRFHTMGLHKPIAHLNAALPRGCVVVDNICGDLDFEEGGNPVTMNRIWGGKDPVLCDAYACRCLGYDISEVEYIGIAQRIGVGSADLENLQVISLNEAKDLADPRKGTRRIQRLARHVQPDSACSACYGSLIYSLNKLDNDGLLRHLDEQVCIGQGCKGKTGCLGVGSCTAKFDRSLKGCPPTAAEMYRFLRAYIEKK